MLLLRGIDALSLSACFLAAGILFYSGPARVLAACVLLGGLSLLVRTDGFAAALLLAGALSAMACSECVISRSAFLLSVAAAILSGSLTGLVPLGIAAAAAVFPAASINRSAFIGAGLAASVAAGGIPLASPPAARRAEEYFVRGGIAWEHSERLDLSAPALVLEAGEAEPADLRILLSAGGVRDDEPVGFVMAGDTSFPVPSGEVRIRMNEPVFPVSVVLSRRWKPMNHPVIHFIGAEAGTE
ncbi:MAG: hypothetical protein R6U39_05255 [Candidatus Aegiribacteria sp.]